MLIKNFSFLGLPRQSSTYWLKNAKSSVFFRQKQLKKGLFLRGTKFTTILEENWVKKMDFWCKSSCCKKLDESIQKLESSKKSKN